jgi:hypothetical protein
MYRNRALTGPNASDSAIEFFNPSIGRNFRRLDEKPSPGQIRI